MARSLWSATRGHDHVRREPRGRPGVPQQRVPLLSFRWASQAALVALAISAACVPTLQLSRTPPPAAQALSLLGDTLWNAPVPTIEQQVRLRALLDARRRLAAQPSDLNTKLLVARRTAEMGRLQEAIALYSE